MEKALGALSAKEFEELVERAIDRRLQVWLTQLMDAFIGLQDEESADLQPEFAASLRRALEQARAGEGIDLETFRDQIGQGGMKCQKR
ncbi:MAG: hypothetical protein ACETWB_09670 [Anaerolineae bacterium]